MDKDDEREFEKFKRDRRKADKKGNLKEVALLCNCIGELLAKYGRWKEAKSEHETELSLSEALNDTIGSAVACRKIGECFCGLEQYDEGLKFQQRHLSLAKSCHNLLEEQRAWATIGRTYLIQTDAAKSKEMAAVLSDQALEAFQKSLEVCEKLKKEVKGIEYMEMKARLFLNMGLVYDGKGNTKQCAEFMKRAITISEHHNLHSDLYRCQYCLASMYQKSGNLSQALRHLDAAKKCATKLKDKYLESDALTQKALIWILLGDYGSSKHALKKAHRLGSTTQEEAERIKKCFKTVSKMEEASSSLETTTASDRETRLKLFETLGDCSADAGNFKRAIEYYLQMLQCAIDLRKSPKDIVPVYVSLAQTYADDQQYKKAIESYNKELDARDENDHEQKCRTWLNIAEIMEQSGEGYSSVSQAYMSAYSHARKAKHRKLEVYSLKSLTEVQKHFKHKSHLDQTTVKLNAIKTKYDISSDDDLLEEEERDSQRSEECDGNLSISELSESGDSDEDQASSKEPANFTGRAKRTTKAKRNEKGETPLHRACIEGNLKKVKKLVEQGHPVNPRDYCGWIPLHEAANHDFCDIVEYLLDHGATVNDRGGQHCGGVTPLIDAANCGNLEIMELLIAKGANVLAKDDEGNTALDCMRSWKRRCETLDDDLMEKVQDLEHKLTSRIPILRVARAEKVKTQSSKASHLHRQDDDTVHSSLPSLVKSKRNTAKDLRRNVSSDSESDSEVTNSRNNSERTATYEEDSQEIYPNPLIDLHLNNDTESATDSYKNAMNCVGLSANRLASSQSTARSHVTKSQKEAQPFVEEEEFVDDDWLIDDVGRASKRRKIDVNRVFSTNSVHKSQRLSNEKTLRRKYRNRDGESLTDEGDLVCDNASGVRSENNFDGDIFTQDGNRSDVEDQVSIVQMDSGSPARSQNSAGPNESDNSNDGIGFIPRRSRIARKPKQLKLTNFGVKRPSTQRTENQVSMVTPGLTMSDSLSTEGHGSGVRQGGSVLSLTQQPHRLGFDLSSIAMPVTRVKVRVKDKLLIVPVFEKDITGNISWLAQEASQRYYKLTGLQPILSLSSSDGGILTGDDPISLILSSNEEVIGKVENWDLPPLDHRYQQVCKTLNIVCYRNIKTILQSTESSGKLNLDDLALRAAQMQPIFRALHCQSSLKELIIKGNRIGDSGMTDLLEALPSLTHLSFLDLCCNEISSNGLKKFCDYLEKTPAEGTPPTLQNLRILNIGHNPLGDSCCHYLATVILMLPSLTDLNLASCEFTAKLFHQNRVTFAEAMQKSNIQHLDLSYNILGTVGAELVLKCLNPGTLLNLNLSGTVSPSSSIHLFLHHLQSYLQKDQCVLQQLSLNDCSLVCEDVEQFTRLVHTGRRLQTLELSGNPKLTNAAMMSLLSSSAVNNTNLESLIMEGCGIASPLDSTFLDSLCDKLSQSNPIRSLRFTCHSLDKVDVDCLSQIWREQWREASVIHSADDVIRLGINDT